MRLISGPWADAQVRHWLAGARIPVRLAVLADRGPLVVSLWYHLADDALWCATRRDAEVVRLVRRDPRVGFEVAPDIPPYRGVRGTARAEVVDERGSATLDALLQRYLDAHNAPLADWLRARSDAEVALRLTELTISSWDFSARMRAQEPGPIVPAPLAEAG